jgi:recombinational DNA repair protein (RecF pathway)
MTAREIVTLWKSLDGECCICGNVGAHARLDRALNDLVCIECFEPLLVAEIEARAWMQRDGLRPQDELRAAIRSFERERGRFIYVPARVWWKEDAR